MQETQVMKQIDGLLLELDAVAKGPLRAVSDALAVTWEQHRAELGTYPPSNLTGASIYGKKCQPSASQHL